jgi:hypothetical protein
MPKPVILSTVERRTGVERAEAGKSPHWWTAPTPDSRPPLKLSVVRCTTAATSSELAGARQARTGIAASRSNTDERIGNHGRGSRGAGNGANREGGYQTTSRQLPEVAPPALQCVSPTSLTVQPGGGRGATWASHPRPPGASESVSPHQTKKTLGTAQARQYVVARRETEGSKRRSRKTKSGSLLHRRGVAARIKAPGQTAPHKSTNGPPGKRIDEIRNPKAGTTANQRLGDAPRISHVPLGGL